MWGETRGVGQGPGAPLGRVAQRRELVGDLLLDLLIVAEVGDAGLALNLEAVPQVLVQPTPAAELQCN